MVNPEMQPFVPKGDNIIKFKVFSAIHLHIRFVHALIL